jgi:hypothetical protein
MEVAMTPPITQRLAALARDTQLLQARIARVAPTLPEVPTRDDATLHAVQPLFTQAERLHDRAVSLATAMGKADLFEPGAVRDADRGAALVLVPAFVAVRSVTNAVRLGEHDHAEVTTSVTPGSDVAAERWKVARRGEDLPNVRIVGTPSQPALNEVADRLENVPQETIERTDRLGDRGALFSGKLTDVWGYRSLKGVHPRGWPEGATWDQVPGAGSETGFAANPGREDRGKGHGSTSLALHEYGHSADAALAPSDRYVHASDSRSWRDGAWREVRQREAPKAYVKSYAEEWFAESFARYTKSQQSSAALARWYPETYAWFKAHAGDAQFRR